MLPLYLDYLERPKIYEGLFYKELGIISEKSIFSEDSIRRIRSKIDETVQTYSKNKAARDAKRALKSTSKSKVAASTKLGASHGAAAKKAKMASALKKSLHRLATEPGGSAKSVVPTKLAPSHGPAAKELKTVNALRKSYHRLATEPGGSAKKAAPAATTQQKIDNLKALNKKTQKGALKKKISTATQQKIDNLKALNKKTQELTGKTKAVVKGGGKTAVSKLKIAAQQTSKLKPAVKKAAPKVASTIKPFMKKAGMVGVGAAAAYGGYKLYKRHFSKAAKKCKGKSGAERTLCLQQATRS
jgi:hypothetical protein